MQIWVDTFSDPNTLIIACHLFISLFICLSLHHSIHLPMSIHLFTFLFLSSSANIFISSSHYLYLLFPHLNLFICSSLHLFIYLCLFIYIPFFPSLNMPIFSSLHFTIFIFYFLISSCSSLSIHIPISLYFLKNTFLSYSSSTYLFISSSTNLFISFFIYLSLHLSTIYLSSSICLFQVITDQHNSLVISIAKAKLFASTSYIWGKEKLNHWIRWGTTQCR